MYRNAKNNNNSSGMKRSKCVGGGMEKSVLLALLNDDRLIRNAAVGDAVFGLFDSSSSGFVSFRDFCRALAWCCRGTRLERLRFLFCLFAMYEQQQLQQQVKEKGIKAEKEIVHNGETNNKSRPVPTYNGLSPDPKTSPRFVKDQRELLHEELALGDLDTEGDSSPKLGRQGLEALLDFCCTNHHHIDLNLQLSFNKFIEWSQTHLSDTIVDQALEPLCVLSTPRSERQAIFTALQAAPLQPGDTVFAIDSDWWQRWAKYVQLSSPLPSAIIQLQVDTGNNNNKYNCTSAEYSSSSQQRPDEIDNSLVIKKDGALKADAFLLLPRSVWELLSRWYGGGPALPRTIVSCGNVDLHPILVRVSACDRNGEVSLKAATTRIERFAANVNLNNFAKAENVLRAYFFHAACQDKAGFITNHESNQSDQVDPLVINSNTKIDDAELTPGQRRRVTILANRLFAGAKAEMDAEIRLALRLDDEDKLYLAKRQAERHAEQEQQQQQGNRISSLMAMALSSSSGSESPPTGVALAYPEDESAKDDQQLFSTYGAGERALRFSKKNQVRLWYRRAARSNKDITISASTNKASRTISQHPLRWRLLDASSLDAVGIKSMDDILIEFCDPVTGEWPRAKISEISAHLKVGDRLDACDYRGKWFPGSVIELERSPEEQNNATSPPRRVRVRFDHFHPKWDEWYDVSSSGLAPLGTRANQEQANSRKDGIPANSPLPMIKKSLSTDSSESTAQSGRTNQNNGLDESNKGGIQRSKNKELAVKDVLPGSTGLVNLGNTCYINSALQCLSHTPLLRAYILSEGYSGEVNRTNPLGTQGRMVEEFASILKQLWSEQYRYIAPNKFKRTLAKLKPQFAGNDQHDSQEFLAEMLDMLHEDVNRVVEKPYVVEPDDDEVDKLTSIDAAREAWDRYLLRNRSVIVDLFQGQLMSERTCAVCSKRSLKFETFMYLSVPLPAPRDRLVKLVLLTRAEGSKLDLSRLEVPTNRPASTAISVDMPPDNGAISDKTTEINASKIEKRSSWSAMLSKPIEKNETSEEDKSIALNGALLQPKLVVPRVVKYVFEIPRLGTVAELKKAIAKRSGIAASDLVIGDVFRHRFIKLWHDTEPLARMADEDFLVAYESTPEPPPDAPEDTFPNTFDALRVGSRVDALDLRGHWFVGMVVAINESGQRRVSFDHFASKWDEWYGPNDFSTKLAPPYTYSKRKARIMEIQVIHRRLRTKPTKTETQQKNSIDYDDDVKQGDNEVCTKEESKELAPCTAETENSEKMNTVSADENEKVRRQPTIPRRPSNPNGVELFGTPFVVRIESDMQVEKLYSKIMNQAQAFVNPKWRNSLTTLTTEKAGPKRPFEIRLAALAQPTLVRVVNNIKTSAEEKKETVEAQSLSSQEHFSSAPDIFYSGRKVLVTDILDEARGAVTLDWLDPTAYDDCFEASEAARDPSCNEHLDDEGRLRQNNGQNVSLATCLDAFSKEETLSDDNFWFCPKCKVNRHAISRILPWKLPDILVIHMKRFLYSANWREKINTRVDFPLTSLDMSTWVHPDASGCDVHHHGAMTYDLFGVINHLGGMTGG